MVLLLSICVAVGLGALLDGGSSSTNLAEPTPPDAPDETTDESGQPRPSLLIGDDGPNVFTDVDSTTDVTIQGRGGDDVVDLTGPSNDIIFGGAGDDNVSPGDGDDEVFLGRGDDFFGDVGGRNDPDYGGDDLVRGQGGNDTLTSLGGQDTLFGDTGNDVINTNDFLPQFDGVQARPDMGFGGLGDDQMLFDDGDTVSGGEGVDAFQLQVASTKSTAVTITDFDPVTEALQINISDGSNPLFTNENSFTEASEFADLSFVQDGADTQIVLNETQVLAILQNVDAAALSAANIQVT
ncbi:calcium-binding protein [Nereida ignava]|uniref:calcium-binding protein n=1 Tax=Nereida ignava TaxID=282199 RepID=UPI0023B4973B